MKGEKLRASNVKGHFSKTEKCPFLSIGGYIIEVETDIANEMPGFENVGYITKKIKHEC